MGCQEKLKNAKIIKECKLTPLHIACALEDRKAFKILLSYKADEEKESSSGYKPRDMTYIDCFSET